jgi:hypothetical protein
MATEVKPVVLTEADKLRLQADELIKKASEMESDSTTVEIGEETPDTKKDLMYYITKGVILGAFVIFGIIGIIGSMGWVSSFKMADYVLFIEKYAWIWGPFVVSVAGGRSIKRIAENIGKKNDAAVAAANSNQGAK